MAQILLQALEPGTQYIVQVRAKNRNGQAGAWSIAYALQTPSDITPPKPVTNFDWVTVGTAFRGTWTKPTEDADNRPLKDLKDYRVQLTANSKTVTYFVSSERFDWTIEQNTAAFDTPQPQITCEVRARDISGNLSSPVSKTATNPPPNNVTDLVVQGVYGAVASNWKAVPDDDLKGYEVYISTTSGFTPGTTTLRYTGLGTSYIFNTNNAVPHYVKVCALDVFNQRSPAYAEGSATPILTTDVDVTPPGQPPTLSVTSTAGTDGQSIITATWGSVTDNDLSAYVLRWSKDGTVWQYSDIPNNVTTATINGLAPGTPYYVAIQAKDFAGNKSAWRNASTYPITTAKDATAPSQPSTPSVSVNTQAAQVALGGTKNSGGNMEADVDYYEVHASTTSGFTPSLSTTRGTIPFVAPGITVQAILPYTATDSITQLYWKVIAVDKAGNKSTASPQATGLPGLIQGQNVASATITDAHIANLNAAKIVAGSAFVNDLFIRANITIDSAGGHIKSNNYNATNKTGWTLDNTGLIIHDGQISAKSLLLQDSTENIAPLQYSDFEFISSYYHSDSYVLDSSKFNGPANLKGQISSINAKFNRQCLRLFDDTLVDGSTDRLFFSASGAAATNLNIDVVAGTYLISVYARRAGSKGGSIRMGMYTDTSATLPGGTGSQSVTNNAWNRFVFPVVITADMTKAKLFADLTASGQTGVDIEIDGIQVERQIGAIASPSQFTPPSTTFIEGGSITTGEIRSSAPAAGATGQPAWSLNAQGNAQFGDALVRGSLVVGAGTDTTNSTVSSADYVAGGETGWVIRGDGSAEFKNMTTYGEASGPTGAYDNLSASTSFLYKGDELGMLINQGPRGIIAYGGLSSATMSTASGSAAVAILELNANIFADRTYKLTLDPARATNTTTTATYNNINETGNVWIDLKYTVDDSVPTVNSANAARWETAPRASHRYLTLGGTYLFGGSSFQGTSTEGYNQVRFLIVLGSPATNQVTRIAFDAVKVFIEDLGPLVDNTGVNRYTPPSTASKKKYVFDIQPFSSRSYREGGAQYNPTNRDPNEIMYQGNYGGNSAVGNLRSYMWFDIFQAAGGAGTINHMKDVPLADVESCQLYLKYPHFYDAKGGSSQLGYHRNSNPGQATEPAEKHPAQIYEWYAGRNIGKWINIKTRMPEVMNAIRAGTFRGFMVGNGNNNAIDYGYAWGPFKGLGDKPGFKAVYWK